jgi:hypothetical protein
MSKPIYDELIKWLTQGAQEDDQRGSGYTKKGGDSFNMDLLNDNPSNRVVITVKNYNSPIGVATALHKTD